MDDRFILLVEDNPDDEALTRRSLAKTDIRNEVVSVRDGAEALDFLFRAGAHGSRPPGEPAVVLLDLKLPKVDGKEVLRRIRADERPRILPVVVLTTSKEVEDVVGSYRMGANSYVRKPVDFTAFFEAVRALGLY